MTATDTHMTRQLALEAEMRDFGVARYRTKYERAVKRGDAGSTEPGRALVKAVIPPMVGEIDAWRAACESGRAGRKHTAYKLVATLTSAEIAFVTAKVAFDCAVNRHNLTWSQTQVGIALADEVWAKTLAQTEKEAFEIARRSLKKRAVTRRKNKKETMKNITRNRGGTVPASWSNEEHVKVGALFLDVCVRLTGFFETPHIYRGKKQQAMFTFSEKTSQWLDRNKLRGELLQPILLPMLVPPVPRTGDLTTGPYHSPMPRPQTMVKRPRFGHREAIEAGDMTPVVDALNTLDRTAWKVSTPVLDVLTAIWRSGNAIAGLPSREELPLPPRPKWMVDMAKKYKGDRKKLAAAKRALPEKKQEIIAKYRAEARRIHDTNNASRSSRVSIERIVGLAEKFAHEDALYFPHDLDFRGRIYDIPHGLHPQGPDWSRGLLVFADGKPVRNKAAMRWLMIHGANTWGNDKVSMDDRVQWVADHYEGIKAVVEDPLRSLWWTEADKPFTFLAWCFDYIGVVDEGKPSHVPIALDGSCNGLQHLSAMLLDSVGGQSVNLVPSAVPNDIYADVAEVVKQMLEKEVEEEGASAYYAEQWLAIGINRKYTKRPTMVMPYGGTIQSTLRYVEEAWHDQKKDNPWGEDEHKACIYLGKVVHRAIRVVVKKASLAMAWLQACARVAARYNVPIKWVTPSSYIAWQEYHDVKLTRIYTHFMGQTNRSARADRASLSKVSVSRELATLNGNEMVSGIAPNFVHSLDAAALINTVNAAAAEGVTHFAMIHDSYGTHAADTDQLAYTLREQFVAIYENHDVLQEFADELRSQIPETAWGEIPPIPLKGFLDIRQVLDSEFFFA